MTQEQSMHCEMVTWGQVYRLSMRVAKKIQDSGFQPEVVIAIARGGFVPARILCDALNLYELESIRIGHYGAGANKAPEARLYSPLPQNLGGRRVLLVDDCSDTGDTLGLALERLRGCRPQAIKVALLHHKKVSPLAPDYYGRKVAAWRWLIYPWAVVEDLSGFLATMAPCPDSPEEALSQLALRHGLKVPRQTVNDVLAAMRRRRLAEPS